MKDILKKALRPIYKAGQRIWFGLRNEWTLRDLYFRHKYKKAFRSFKDIHKGERCFIIGNGPSLTAEDLDLLRNEVSFAANRIFYIFEKTQWRPTYYCSQDEQVINDIKDKFPELLNECKNMFLIRTCYKKVPEYVRRSKKTLFYCVRYLTAHRFLKFCDDISYHISGGSSITYAAMQIAAYMGFKEIYLIGVDHSYCTSTFKDHKFGEEGVKGSYFEGMPSNITGNMPNLDASTLSFIKAKEYCDANGIKIVNATRGGKLEVFPRKALEEILK